MSVICETAHAASSLRSKAEADAESTELDPLGLPYSLQKTKQKSPLYKGGMHILPSETPILESADHSALVGQAAACNPGLHISELFVV